MGRCAFHVLMAHRNASYTVTVFVKQENENRLANALCYLLVISVISKHSPVIIKKKKKRNLCF